MGEEKWTHREPGSISGSVVPPPAEPSAEPLVEPLVEPLAESPVESAGPQTATPQPATPQPATPPLPRRQPRSKSAQAASASADSASADSASAGSVSADSVPGPLESLPSIPRRAGGSAQRHLQVAGPISGQPQLPDNVRYLFRPVLTQATTTTTGPVTEASGAAVRERPPAGEAQAPQTQSPQTQSPQTQSPQAQPPAAQFPREQSPLAQSPSAQSKRKGGLAGSGTHRRQGKRESGGQLWRHVTLAAAVFLIVGTAVGTAFTLVGHGQVPSRVQQASSGRRQVTRGGGLAETGARALTGLSNAAIVRSEAASWIVREISRSMIIACDAVMCGELFNAGVPASNLLVLSPTATDPLGADIVIGTPALRSEFGRRLVTEYAPSVIASFGSGNSRVDVRVVAPDGAAAYELALSHDLAARQQDGSLLLRNSKIEVAASARPDLIAGLVDPRLLVMLPVLAEQHPIEILGFYDQAPHASQGVPLTGVELAATDQASGVPGGSYRRWLINFVNGQRPPYRPVSVTSALVHGRDLILIRFARPSPIGLLNG